MITCSCDWGHDIKFQGIPSLTPPLRFTHFPSMRNPALWPIYIIDNATFHRLVWYSSSSEDSTIGCMRYYQVIQLITPRILVQAFNRCKTVSDPMNLSSLTNSADYGLSPLSSLEIKPSDGILRHSGHLSSFIELSVFHESGILDQTTRIAHNDRIFYNYRFLW